MVILVQPALLIAVAMQGVSALALAISLFLLYYHYRRGYLLQWTIAWVLLSLFSLGFGLTYRTTVDSPDSVILILGPILMLCAHYMHLAALFLGTYEMARERSLATRTKALSISLAFLVGVGAVIATHGLASPSSQILARLGSAYAFGAVTSLLVAASVWRYARHRGGVGYRLVTLGFLFWGLKQIHYLFLQNGVMSGPYDLYLGFVDSGIFFFLALGSVIWFLEEERARSDQVSAQLAEVDEELMRRLAFETLLSRTSRAFINVGRDALDAALEVALRDFAVHLKARQGYIAWFADNRRGFSHVYMWSADGGVFSRERRVTSARSESFRTILQRSGFAALSTLENAEEFADSESRIIGSMVRSGSALISPLRVAGVVEGFVAFGPEPSVQEVATEVGSRIELIGELFANAWARRRAEEAAELSEERFVTSFRASPDAISISTLEEGRIIDANEVFLSLTGRAREDVIGLTSYDLDIWVNQGDRESLVDRLRDTGNVRDLEFRIRTWNRGVRTFLISAELIHLAGESCLLAVSRDITERKELEERLHQSQKLEAIGQLAGGVAHDFNNILTVVAGHADFIASDAASSERILDSAREIRGAFERGAALTNQLLAFARKQIHEKVVVDPAEVVFSLEEFLNRLIEAPIEMRLHRAIEPGHVFADKSQLELAVMNLVVNARDAMPDGGAITISVDTVSFDESVHLEGEEIPLGDWVRVQVRDTGTGMSTATKTRAFEPFFTTKERGEGTGLGLATVYGIVKQSQGRITLESEEGRGTKVCIYLPKVAKQVPAPSIEETTESVSAKGEMVLLVEDSDSVKRFANDCLNSLGYKVVAARSGGEALVAMEDWDEPFDLLLTDVVMPGVSGVELARIFRSKYPDSPILFMSGYPGGRFDWEGKGDTEIEFIKKPFTGTDLGKRLRQLLDRSRAQTSRMT